MPAEPLSILLGEDDDGHATLVRRNMQRAGIGEGVLHLKDGQAVLDFVRCTGQYAARRRGGPLLVLLDHKMPRVDGLEVLRQLKADRSTAHVPVIMLTTTDDPREVQRCYELGCSVYVTKPVVYEEFVEVIRRLALFLAIARVPREDDRA